MKINFFRAIFILSCIAFFASCSGRSEALRMASSTDKANLENDLRARVTEYYEAKIAGKQDLVYTFFNDAFKKSMSKPAFVASPRTSSIKGFKIDQVTLSPSGTEAQVMLKVDIEVRGVVFKEVPQKQNWIIENGVWVNVPPLAKPLTGN